MKRILVIVIPALVLMPPLAGAGWLPDPDLSTFTMAYSGYDPVTLYCVPDGSGDAFTQARLPWGGVVDATVTVTLVDLGGVPIFNYPAEDIWLESLDGGLTACAGGAIADRNTDPNGQTVFSAPMRAGGHAAPGTRVIVSGLPLAGTPMNLGFISPDISGNRRVDLEDVALFATDFFGGYRTRSDLHQDGRLDLADLAKLARAMGKACP